ncbi:MAG: hypothetical protein GEEBNDBF_01372 [bacterium]|nr:hypothetical protein [bacterium]
MVICASGPVPVPFPIDCLITYDAKIFTLGAAAAEPEPGDCDELGLIECGASHVELCKTFRGAMCSAAAWAVFLDEFNFTCGIPYQLEIFEYLCREEIRQTLEGQIICTGTVSCDATEGC